MKRQPIRLATLLICWAAVCGAQAQVAQPEQLVTEMEGLLERMAPVEEKLQVQATGTVVEFFNANLKHYFRTAEPAEVTAVMNGAAGAGWVRTGDDFPAWVGASIGDGALPVCRFYAPGANSHFYTISASECASVKLDPGWQYEGISFYALPANGTCTGGYTPVYRAYNNRFAFSDSNHRFTTSSSAYQQMMAQGWSGEGVVMCAPPTTTTNQQKTQQLIGGTWVIPYYFGSSRYTDRLTYTSLYQSTTGEVYASGISGHGVLTLGQYVPSLSQWLMMAPYSSSNAYPADVYAVTITGNTMSGCYYFAVSASLMSSCTAITGTR